MNIKKISKNIQIFIDKQNPSCYNEDDEGEHKKNIIDFKVGRVYNESIQSNCKMRTRRTELLY